MRSYILLCSLLMTNLIGFSQEKFPDTLVVQIKTGEKILLVGKDVSVFKTIKIDSIIKRALITFTDSIPLDKTPGSKISKKDFFPGVLLKKRAFIFQPGIGLGLIKDRLSPFWGVALDFGAQRQDYNRGDFPMYTFINLAMNAYYTFENTGSGLGRTFNNIFIEGSIGNRVNNRPKKIFNFDEFAFGAGYLIRDQGSYFQKNTVKAFFSVIPAYSFIRLRPEVFFTDNFSKAWPGLNISAKILGESPLLGKRKKGD